MGTKKKSSISTAEAKRRKINRGLALTTTGREQASMARKALSASPVNRRNKAASMKRRKK